MHRALRARRTPRLSSLPSENVPLSPRIGAATQRAGLRVDANGDHACAHRIGSEDAQLVSPGREIVAHVRRHTVFNLEDARQAFVIVERAEWMQRGDPRRLDTFLN